jgi:hypothetical protein
MSTVNCPACEEALELDDTYRDWTVRCPHCGREFVPSEVGRRPPPRDEPDEDDGGDYVYGYEESDRREALALVSAPAICMEVVGWSGVVIAGALCALLVVGALSDRNGGEALLLMSGCLGVLVIPYSLAMAVGGYHMRNLSSRGWAMAAAILGVASFTLISVCGVLHTAVGVWALVTLDKPVVRRAFGMSDRRKRRWED